MHRAESIWSASSSSIRQLMAPPETEKRKIGVRLVKVAELHDVVKAGLIRSVLDGQGIPCLLRGYYYRALFYFFGPYVEISVFVPEDKRDDASELINNFAQSSNNSLL